MPVRLHFVVTEIHREFSEKVIEWAEAYSDTVGAEVAEVTWVPGSLEIPLAIADILDGQDVEAFVVIGVLEQGETKHGEVIGHQVTRCLLDLQLQHRVPMAVSIIGPGATMAHAFAKGQGTTEKAIRVAMSMLKLKHKRRKGIP